MNESDSLEYANFFSDEVQSGQTIADWEQKRASHRKFVTPPLEPSAEFLKPHALKAVLLIGLLLLVGGVGGAAVATL